MHLKYHPKSMSFVVETMVYLGHQIVPNGIMTYYAKVSSIVDIIVPMDIPTMHSFWGL